jgi:hypothetical protein
MAKTHIIKGIVAWQDLGPGFWSVIGDDGGKWRPVSMPKKFQKEGLRVSLEVEEVKDEISIFMWGMPVKIVGGEAL